MSTIPHITISIYELLGPCISPIIVWNLFSISVHYIWNFSSISTSLCRHPSLCFEKSGRCQKMSRCDLSLLLPPKPITKQITILELRKYSLLLPSIVLIPQFFRFDRQYVPMGFFETSSRAESVDFRNSGKTEFTHVCLPHLAWISAESSAFTTLP